MPEDYPDEDGYTVDRNQMEWWQHHKREGHRVEWHFGGVPLCLTCGSLYEDAKP